MALESAINWLNKIHKDQDLGRKLLAVPEGNWNVYFSIAKENGFDFIESELAEAWDNAYGAGNLSDADLDNVVGGASGINHRLQGVAMGIRG